ncbi:hypothetical protein AB5I41_03865 [Sphingomonas sp. MMS24-JH45]
MNENLLRGGNSITNPRRAFQAQAAVSLPTIPAGASAIPCVRRRRGSRRAGQSAQRRGVGLHRYGLGL